LSKREHENKEISKTIEDSYLGRYLKKWRKRGRAAKEGHIYLSLYNPSNE
jgi:hypothetical protein